MADFPKLMVTFIVITLFAFLLIGFATRLGQEYGKDEAITELEERIGSSAVTEQIEDINTESEIWKKKFFEEKSDEEDLDKGIWASVSNLLGTFEDVLDIIGILAVGIFNLVKNMGTFIFLPFLMFNTILTNVIGIPGEVASIIQVIIILSLIFGIWKLIKTGT